MENHIDVLGFESFYTISNLGNINSLKRNVSHSNGEGDRVINSRLLKPTLNKKTGYLYVSLSKKGIVKKFNIHQLMGICFLDLKPDGTNRIVVDHIDSNKLNNSIVNLQIISNRHNCSKDKTQGTSIYVGVRKNKGKFESQIRIGKTRKYLGSFENEIDAHNAYQNALNDVK